MSWNEEFNNPSSREYMSAVQNLSAALTSALISGNTNRRMFAALPSGTSGSVQVAQLREGQNGSIICFAYGTVYGNVDASALPSYSAIQSQINSTTSLATGATVDTVSSPINSPCNVTDCKFSHDHIACDYRIHFQK
ncbi:unnamed protein product [Cylicocyclus nassatus]|uniref:Uncharacterized protein n=1 Tax=Cylicocyclus nassatus TaxID=53992 RepID=A0AA36HAR7_CYLNA|nr:unnamed protein product [Cylicocyclus nassatus]